MSPTIIAGNITDDPDLRSTQGGQSVANTVVSTPRVPDWASNCWKDGETIFLRCTAWWAAAENAAQSLHKGDRVLVAGRLR